MSFCNLFMERPSYNVTKALVSIIVVSFLLCTTSISMATVAEATVKSIYRS